MIPFCALNVFWKVPSRSWKRGEGQRRRQRVPTNICRRILGPQKGGPGDLLSKMGVLARVHEIPKSIWRYYTSENGDVHLNTKLDLCKSLKFSNRSGACIVAKTVIFRSNLVDNVGLQKQAAGSKSSRSVNPAACADPAEGVRGGKPTQGTGGRTYSSIDAMYPLDTADLNAARIPPGQN